MIKSILKTILGIAVIAGVVVAYIFVRPSAQLLLITEETYRAGVNNIGDIVGVYDGNHEFSEGEKSSFQIIKIKGKSKNEIESELQKLLPKGGETTSPKYQFRIKDSSKLEIKDNIETNVKLK